MNTRTNIVIDDQLIAKAMERAGVKTKKAAVEAALRAYVRKPDYSGLLALAGSGVLADDYDPKALFTHVQKAAPVVMEPPAGYAVETPARARRSSRNDAAAKAAQASRRAAKQVP